MGIYDSLRDLYALVVGKQPRGRTPTPTSVRAAERRLTSHVLPEYAKEYPRIPVPKRLLDFFSAFGGEPALVESYYRIFPVNRLIGTVSHVVFADDPRAGRCFAVDHIVINADDPSVDAVVGPADVADQWDIYSDHLSECLVQFACWNLQESLPYDLIVTDTDHDRFQEQLAGFQSIPLTDTSPGGMQCRPYCAPGTMICYEPFAKTAMIGFDSLDRAIEFQKLYQWRYDSTYAEDEHR